MPALSLDRPEISGFEPLAESEMSRLDGGIPWAPIVYAVGVYLAKTVADKWASFKAGVRRGIKDLWRF